MQPIIHFLMSMIAGLGVGLHLDDKIKKYVLLCALSGAATAIDLDHILPIYEAVGVKIFHNVFVFVALPVSLFFISMRLEKKKRTTLKQRAFLILSVMFAGHMFLDSITTGVPLYYPLTDARFTIMKMEVVNDAHIFSLTSWQLIMIFWGVMIMVANLVETAIYRDAEGRMSGEWPGSLIKTEYRRGRGFFPALLERLSTARIEHRDGFFTYEEMRHKEVNLGQYDAATEYIFNFVDNLRSR